MNKFWGLIEKVENFVMVMGMAIMVVLNFLNVVFRMLLPQTPFSYSEELTIIIFIWVTMFAISYGFKVHAHTVLDFLTKKFPIKGQKAVVVLGCVCSMVFMAIIAYTAYFTIQNQITFNQVTPGMKLPMYINSGALFLGSIITFFSIVRSGQLELAELKEKGYVPEAESEVVL